LAGTTSGKASVADLFDPLCAQLEIVATGVNVAPPSFETVTVAGAAEAVLVTRTVMLTVALE
jgi:hypothetical protein